MPTYITLLRFTDEGARGIRDSPHRADTFNEVAERAGARVVAQYWTLGSYDGVVILEAPDEETAAAVLLHLNSSGSVRTRTMRAFEWSEVQDLLERD